MGSFERLTIDPKVKDDVLKALYRSDLEGIAIVNREGRFLAVNRAYQELVGYSESELQNLRYQDITPPSDRTYDEMQTENLAAGKLDKHVMIKQYITKTHALVWVKLEVTAINNDNSIFMFFVSRVRSLTVAESGFKPITNPDGQPVAIRPSIKLGDFVRDNWKTVLPLALAVFGGCNTGVITLYNKYEETIREAERVKIETESRVKTHEENAKKLEVTAKELEAKVKTNESQIKTLLNK